MSRHLRGIAEGENTLRKEESFSYKNFLVHRIQFLSSETRRGKDGNGLKVGNIGQRF